MLVDGLTREVVEETGVEVFDWDGPVYEVFVEAPDLGWRARVEVHVAGSYRGDLQVDDPDGIVVEAAWVAPARCPQHLATGHRWVREPVVAWLDSRRDGGTPPSAVMPRTFRYHVAGRHPADAVVTAL